MHFSLNVGVMTEMLISEGRLDDLRVYDSALGGQEILQIFAGDDLEENLIQHQFDLLADGDPTEFSVSGLPLGVELDTVTGEVFGLPQEVGVFDLNVSAFNIAGEGKANLRVIVNKTSPLTSSVPPRSVTSSSAKMSAQVVSDGGEPVQLSLFWGETDGGTNANIDPVDPNLWDYRIDLNGNYSDGLISHFVSGLDMNETYFYRWMAGNSVNSESWSTASEDGMLVFWDLNDNTNAFSLDKLEVVKQLMWGFLILTESLGKKAMVCDLEVQANIWLLRALLVWLVIMPAP